MHPVSLLSRGNQRYHVTLGSRRTTVSLDNFLSLLLSLKLGHTPQTPQAQRAVRHWLLELVWTSTATTTACKPASG